MQHDFGIENYIYNQLLISIKLFSKKVFIFLIIFQFCLFYNFNHSPNDIKLLLNFTEKSSNNIKILTYLITVAEHRRKHILQQRKYMFICFEKTSHSLKFHNIYIWAFSNYLKKNYIVEIIYEQHKYIINQFKCMTVKEHTESPKTMFCRESTLRYRIHPRMRN